MSNCNFNSVLPTQTPLDPHKRVKYSMGLVLGVEEFEQEQYYLMERDRLHHRILHGYGTAAGLKVELKTDESDVPTVMVSPGIAVNPRGDTICVPVAQCANLEDWFKENAGEVAVHLAEDGYDKASLYVVLCYKECPTDDVPIPGAPCRSSEDVLAPSRIADYFDLSIIGTPPDQVEEDYIRCFGKFLRRIEISKYAPAPMSKEEMVDKVKELFGGMGSPPECPFDEEVSPPDDDKYYIAPGSSAEILEAVFRVWVTEIRPVLLHKAGVCAGVSDSPEVSGLCVLLAQLDVKVTKVDDTWKLGTITGNEVIEDRRPMLLHTRLLQEWMLFGCYGALKPDTHTFATLAVKDPKTILAWVHSELLDIPLQAIKIEINGKEYSPKSTISNFPDTNVFEISLKDKNYSIENNSRVKVGFDVTAITVKGGASSAKKLSEVLLAADYIYLDREDNWLWSYCTAFLPSLDDLVDVDVPKPENNQILTWDEQGRWIATDKPIVIKDHGALDGLKDDDHEHYFNLERGDGRYAQINHTHELKLDDLSDVTATSPKDGNALLWNSTNKNWVPGGLPSGGLSLEEIAAQLPVLPFVTIRDSGVSSKDEVIMLHFQLWFHLDTGGTVAPKLSNIDVSVYNEDLAKKCTVKKLEYKDLAELKGKCNVYNLSLNVTDIAKTDFNAIYLRFVFDLDKSTCNEGSLTNWMNKMPLKWVGHDGKNTVTVFHHARKTDILRSQYALVAAGRFKCDQKTVTAEGPTINGLRVEFDVQNKQVFLNFIGYNIKTNYIVTGTPIVGAEQRQNFGLMVSGNDAKGISLVFSNAALMPSGFMVEINEIL